MGAGPETTKNLWFWRDLGLAEYMGHVLKEAGIWAGLHLAGLDWARLAGWIVTVIKILNSIPENC